MSANYKIVERCRYDKYGELIDKKYYVMKKVSLLYFWEKWEYVTHQVSGISCSIKVNTSFESRSEAIDFAEKCLCNNNPYDGYIDTDINIVECDEQT